MVDGPDEKFRTITPKRAKLQKSCRELCSLQVFLDKLKDVDFPPLIDVFSAIDSSEIDTVDILHESPYVLNGELVLSLMRAINQKLRVVDLQDSSFGKDGLRDLLHGGLTCEVLNLRSSHIRKLNMIGMFMHLHTLNLDFSISLTSFHKDCFTCMPKLMRLSMCETRVANLWTTSAALSKLPSLVELRFQNCLCCSDTAPCPASSNDEANYLAGDDSGLEHLDMYPYPKTRSITTEDLLSQNLQSSFREETIRNSYFVDNLVSHAPLQSTTEDSSDDSEVDFSSHQRRVGLEELLSNVHPELGGWAELENEVFSGTLFTEEEGRALADTFNLSRIKNTPDIVPKKYISHHPSPICFEKHYREYMVASLPRLKVLDNLPIKRRDREMARNIFSQYYEYLPYNRQCKESVVSILHKREMGAVTGHLQKSPKLKEPYPSRRNQCFFSRSICAAKVGSFTWPVLHPVSNFSSISGEETKTFRPRQFEYHPAMPSLMVFGTLDGEIVVINHESGKLVGYLPSLGTLNSVLGLCWLRRFPSKLIAGSDNGSLQLYDINQMPSVVTERHYSSDAVIFDDFEQLTSVHVNSTDEHFIASGYSKNVALYDIGSGRRLQVFTNMHEGHINVVKFAHHSPSIFASSSFDQDIKMWDLRQGPQRPCYTVSSSRGNVMVCFSPDDKYLLSSAVDNEVVKQLLAVDGRVHMKFDIASTGSAHNYTRSYYMNGRDYIISGSCDENIVRICCAQTGRRLRDISLEGRGPGNSMFVQSLRGDPFRVFHMSVLAAYMRPSSKSQIIKVNLMASSDNAKDYSYNNQRSRPSCSMGG
ncbi:WD40 repeat [Macleaya cordata]|uniref:WD40 repeat n=1 Tax=Macleaya cordata TaxID=56857 RepID=A0A200PS16_MACCD|nr:WD40 repeat [Macleaya cordata]